MWRLNALPHNPYRHIGITCTGVRLTMLGPGEPGGSAVDAPGPSAGDAPVILTEVASDSDLFDDPDVEVARLDGAEDREIVVPVEVGEGASKRRYKLSIRLHLDPVD